MGGIVDGLLREMAQAGHQEDRRKQKASGKHDKISAYTFLDMLLRTDLIRRCVHDSAHGFFLHSLFQRLPSNEISSLPWMEVRLAEYTTFLYTLLYIAHSSTYHKIFCDTS